MTSDGAAAVALCTIVVAVLLWRVGSRRVRQRPSTLVQRSPSTRAAPGPLHFDDPPGHYMSVAGESYHQDALRLILATRGRSVSAELVAEPSNPHDPNAVRVVIDGVDVGHLSRSVAADFARYVTRPIGCAATLSGGEPGKPSIGVVLEFSPVYAARDRARKRVRAKRRRPD